MKHLRAALLTAVDLILDAVEADAREGEEHAPAPPLAKTRASRRGTALRMFTPSIDLTPEDLEKAQVIARRKGI